MDSKTKTIFGLVVMFSVAIALSQTADASTISNFATYFKVMAEGQLDLIHQNDVIVKQQQMIIEEIRITNTLLKGNSNIFVAGITERYDILEYNTMGSCVFYDRLEREIKTETCPVIGLTKDAFNSLITGNPQN